MYTPTQLSEEELCIKEKLHPILLDTYNKVDGIIAGRIKWHIDRFSTREKAEKELLQKYHPQLFNDYYDTNIIIELRNLFQNKKEDEDIIQMLSHEIAYYMSVFCPPSDINVDNEWVKWVTNHLTAHEIVRRLTNSENQVESLTKNTQQKDPHITDVRNIIENQFYNKGEINWSFAFKQEKDFETFITILINFFVGTEYQLCDTISLKVGCKTRLARILNDIYKELSEDKLRPNKKFLDIVRVLSPYKDDPKLYNTLTK